MQGVLGVRIKKARTELGLSQAAFARAIGLSSEFISLLEADKRAPSLTTLNKIASFLKKDIGYFLQEKEGAFNILLRGAEGEGGAELAGSARPAVPAMPEDLDASARSILQKFKKYCDDYLRLERLANRVGPNRRLELAPLYTNISPERLAEEERRRLGLGDEPIRDVFALSELNGCRILRLPIPASSKLSGAFIFLEDKEAAFVLINSADTPGRQAFTAAHEYCHYLKDRYEGPLLDNPDVFVDEYVSLYHPREEFAQTFAAGFLMPASKVRAIIEKEFGGRRLTFDHVLYLKRYFGVSFAAMLRNVRELGFVSAVQFEDYIKRDPDSREREVFGARAGERARAGRSIFSDRYKLLQLEVKRKKLRALLNKGKI
jgi:Zn-dependent peptidase ImmA (M78 family)